MQKLNFGPLVLKDKIDSDLVEELLNESKKLTIPYNNFLAGKIKNEYGFESEKIIKYSKILNSYFDLYLHELSKFKNIEISNFKYEYDGMWVNIQKANEYNPPHNHAGHISFVIYLKIDKSIYYEKNESISSPAGSITFQFLHSNKVNGLQSENLEKIDDLVSPINGHNVVPMVGDIIIFPSYLTHHVESFKSPESERISVAGNIILRKNNSIL